MNIGIPFNSLFATVALGRTPVQSMRPFVPSLPNLVMRAMAMANLPFHLPALPTKPLNSLPTVACAANLASDGSTTTPAGGAVVSE